MDTSNSEVEVLHWPAIWHWRTTESCTVAAHHQPRRGMEVGVQPTHPTPETAERHSAAALILGRISRSTNPFLMFGTATPGVVFLDSWPQIS
jgi:hypothetical protein